MSNSNNDNAWGETPSTQPLAKSIKAAKAAVTKESPVTKPAPIPTSTTSTLTEADLAYDLEGLMTDFPTAKELEKFVFDQTAIVLNLKGRSNKFKYQTAMDVLNGKTPDIALLGNENPYLDKNDLIPVDELKKLPARPREVVGEACVTSFIAKNFPHPDPDFQAQGQLCEVVFRKYANNVITYEIIGPITTRPVGVRVNKFGKEVPEKYTWVDPRTGEQIVRSENGMLTGIGTRLKKKMSDSQHRVGNRSQWEIWIDREFVFVDNNSGSLNNIWGNDV